jgi:protein-tyrosine phosphatase
MAFKIATVELENGARIGVCPLPGRAGQLDADMIELLRWKPDVVVTMTGQSEMERGGAAEMPQRLAAAGVAWKHFPIVDYGAPEKTSGDWPALSAELHAILDRGGSVLAHCYGGHGRAGMVALRLLTERGENPKSALARIRAVRPGAVEADTQFRWAAAGSSRGVSGGW